MSAAKQDFERSIAPPQAPRSPLDLLEEAEQQLHAAQQQLQQYDRDAQSLQQQLEDIAAKRQHVLEQM
eukprot:593726-Alexandrium_andersonii.AAC.1